MNAHQLSPRTAHRPVSGPRPTDPWHELCGALAVLTEVRLELLRAVAQGETTVGRLAASVELEPNLISYHLAAMRGAGLVEFRKRAAERVYTLSPRLQVERRGAKVVVRVRTAGGCLMSFAVPDAVAEVPSKRAAQKAGAEPPRPGARSLVMSRVAADGGEGPLGGYADAARRPG